ncbi:MAG: T9SS type A sorting domain-containing protein, partial [Bacteroidota bacterium]
GSNPLAINQNTSFTPTDSTFGISWISSGQSGVTLPPNTTLFSLCFSPVAVEGTTELSFDSYLPPEFIQAGTVVLFPFNMVDGSVTVIAAEVQSMLPGDTNRDSLVNANDLLNIGLGFGQTGPSRPNASTEFSFQSAPIWTFSTPVSAVNYCHVNTDGNTIINSIDAAVLEANFGQSMLGLWELPVIEQSGVNMPTIYVDSEPVMGGQLASVDVFVGDSDEPVGPGYGVAFSIQIPPDLVDLESVAVSYGGSFLGNDLLTFDAFYPNQPGLLEIAATRKDQTNAETNGGKICSITFRPVASTASYNLDWLITPYRYIDNQENATALAQAISQIIVEGTVNVNEPSWASELIVSPNPIVNNGFLYIEGVHHSVRMIELVAADGRLMQEYNRDNTTPIDLRKLPNGQYYLRFISQEGTVTRKLLVAQ